MIKKSKGGKGKKEEERNKAVALLHKSQPDYFNVSVLSRIFQRNRKTIYGILEYK